STLIHGTAKTPSSRVSVQKLDEMVAKARADLAMRLGGKIEDVTMVNWLPLRLPARELRCEVASGGAAGGPVMPGYPLQRSHKDREYTYRSDMQSVTACPRIEEK